MELHKSKTMMENISELPIPISLFGLHVTTKTKRSIDKVNNNVTKVKDKVRSFKIGLKINITFMKLDITGSKIKL